MNVKAALAGMATVALTAPALAHHSFSMFDQQKNLFIDGTVKEFEWTNPHSWLYVVTKDANGKLIQWGIEMGGPGQIARGGWRHDTVKSGDKVVVEIHPLKDGTHGGQFLTAKLADGRVIGQVDGGIRSLPAPGGDEEALGTQAAGVGNQGGIKRDANGNVVPDPANLPPAGR